MDTSIRRYLSSKSSILSFRSPDRLELASPLPSVQYESTAPGPKSPVFISQPLRRSFTEQRARSAEQGLAIRSFSYESALPGKAPIIGGRPHRGNGPVKLQTCRRLSSGELLVTSQDYQRTLEDILEGDYVIGGATKRTSRAGQVKSPTLPLSNSTSPRHSQSRWRASRQSSISGSQSPGELSPGLVSQEPWTSPDVSTSNRPFTSQGKYVIHEPILETCHEQLSEEADGPAVTAPETSSTPELHSYGQHRLSTVAALRKAQRAHLATMRSHDRSTSASPMSWSHSRVPSSLANDMPQHSALSDLPLQESSSAPELAHQAELPLKDLSEITTSCSVTESDGCSDASSNKRSSLLQSDASSSLHTIRTSICEEPTSTRDEVHRLVDSMRINYLMAIEEKSGPGPRLPAASPTKLTQPPSDLTPDVTEPTVRPTRPRRLSWHSSDITAPQVVHAWRWASDPSDGLDIVTDTSAVIDGEDQDHIAEPKLERADSLTLGTLMTGMKSPRPPQKAQAPSPSGDNV